MGETTRGRTGKWAKRPGGETTLGERESGRNDSGANGKVGETTRIRYENNISCQTLCSWLLQYMNTVYDVLLSDSMDVNSVRLSHQPFQTHREKRRNKNVTPAYYWCHGLLSFLSEGCKCRRRARFATLKYCCYALTDKINTTSGGCPIGPSLCSVVLEYEPSGNGR